MNALYVLLLLTLVFVGAGVIADAPHSRAELAERMDRWYESVLDEWAWYAEEWNAGAWRRSEWYSPKDSLLDRMVGLWGWLRFRVDASWVGLKMRVYWLAHRTCVRGGVDL